MLEIRPEQAGDAEAIRRLTDAAFAAVPYSSKTEGRIVDALRASGALTISLVAIEDGEIVGHVAFSPVTIRGEENPWYGLGPLSVRPARQRQGIGRALIREGLDRLRHMQAAGAVLIGDPGYYGRFGFVAGSDLRYGEVPTEYVQHLSFTGAAPRGEILFHAGFDVP